MKKNFQFISLLVVLAFCSTSVLGQPAGKSVVAGALTGAVQGIGADAGSGAVIGAHIGSGNINVTAGLSAVQGAQAGGSAGKFAGTVGSFNIGGQAPVETAQAGNPDKVHGSGVQNNNAVRLRK